MSSGTWQVGIKNLGSNQLMQGLTLWALSFPPAVGSATQQGNSSTAWRLEQVVFWEHKPSPEVVLTHRVRKCSPNSLSAFRCWHVAFSKLDSCPWIIHLKQLEAESLGL